MPPKHKIGRKRNETQSNTWIQSVPSSASDKHIIDSTIQDSIGDDDSSLDIHSIPFTTDVLTIAANDRHYVRVSKQILQYKLKRKRMNVEPMMEQALLEDDTINLPASTTSDWRLVLQDSITTDDLRQGCISLFEQDDSLLNLTPNEVFHAVHFLEYATIHMKYREYPHKHLLETIFPEERKCHTKLTSALIKLVCHPSDKLRAAALSFFDVGISNTSQRFYFAMAMAGHLFQLFEHLKPHSIPINETTIDFHHHNTSILDKFLRFSSWNRLRLVEIQIQLQSPKMDLSKVIDPIFRLSCAYLRHLLAPSGCRSDIHYGLSLLTKTTTFLYNITVSRDDLLHAELQRFFQEVRKIMTEEFASLLGLATPDEALHELLFGDLGETDELRWTETFENILVRLSEGKQCSDLGLEAFKRFIYNQPFKLQLVFRPNGTFSIEVDDRIVSSMERPTNSLRTLLASTRPDHAASILAHIKSFTTHLNSAALLNDIKSGWFAAVFGTFAPSKLPFTSEFRSLHTYLIYTMKDYLDRIQKYAESNECDQIRSEQDEICHSFVDQTRDYIVHLSLHPLALRTALNANTILDFLTHFFGPDFENGVMRPFRDEVRNEMDEAALSPPSPPFILTSELVCRLTDDEIMNVVDRIVALLESDSPIDDDTILRICSFHTNQLKCVYLPELFRKAERSTEQYFHTLNTLISLPIDCFDLHPINSLITPKPKTLQPTLDEWDDVDLATVGIVLPTIHEDRLSFKSASSQLLDFANKTVHQLSHCATRLTLSQLERLISPSISVINKSLLLKSSSTTKYRRDRETAFIELSRLCEQRTIAQCLRRIGFFSPFLSGLLDDDLSIGCTDVIDISLRQARTTENEETDRKTFRRSVHHFLEEGWQDVLDFVLTRKKDSSEVRNRIGHVKDMMQFLGANFHCQVKGLFTR
ncbi:hypothetical protein BLNAU_3025 [Blattamonas nauphoetae]|uniref:Spindle pole body component n=1 Tax=Blattamonas nauphoetae TaxID=2049346 RepID=A0ABQ9YEF4_9EUKA|nr:hypothetical protein BLNAU_3025 [Blattamonas nauphoetae]